LSWVYRSRLILEQLALHDADIICLQEVQAEHFSDFFMPELAKLGYEGHYKSKTSEIFTPGAGKRRSGKMTIDGCATFFRSDLFAFQENLAVEIFNASQKLIPSLLPEVASSSSQTDIKRLLKDNVALVLVLQDLHAPPA